jgi:N,N'-diacetyllegionaminate synthase
MRTIIIAEAGVNHNGNLELAKKLIKVAADAKVDYVKFQTFKADKLSSREAIKANYQITNTRDNDDSQYKMLKKLEMPYEWHLELIEYAESSGVKFLSTGFDLESVDFLDSLKIDFFKIPSGEITNRPYLAHIARKNKPVILSTGMATLKEVKNAIQVMVDAGLRKENLTVLHCNTEYPTPMNDVNLRAMVAMKDGLGVSIGYSDHTLGIEIPIAAVALGATIIEKHFTLDRNLPGPDHKASLEPDELTAMVETIRNVEKALSGSGIKEPSESEYKNITIARKSIHVGRELDKGSILKAEDLIMLRPGDGISPMHIDDVVGRRVRKNLKENTQLTWDLIE